MIKHLNIDPYAKSLENVGTFLDNLEDQIKGCAFSQSGVNSTEEAKKFLQSFMSNFQ